MNLLELSHIDIGRNLGIVRDINCTIGFGELVILTGNNGSGKSTLLKTITGIIPELKGKIKLNGVSLKNFNKIDLAKHIAFAGTERIREDYITIEEMIRFGRYPYANSEAAAISDNSVSMAIQQMKIEDIKHKYLDKVSDGEWQKANVARALAQETPLIIMDEPTAFLDYPSRLKLFQDLKTICNESNKSIIVSTHDIHIANSFGSLFWHIESQSLISSTTVPLWSK